MCSIDESTAYEDYDRGFHHTDSDTWWKPTSRHERKVYRLLGQHPRILSLQGYADSGRFLRFEYHPKRDLWAHLIEHPQISLRMRIDWAVQIAEGLEHLHSNSVVWGHGGALFSNILVTDADAVVLCDFANAEVVRANGAANGPDSGWEESLTPTQALFTCPAYLRRAGTPECADIFAFGVMLFALLARRFPWAVDITPAMEERVRAARKHRHARFDVLKRNKKEARLGRYFAGVLQNCFHGGYANGEELVRAMKKAQEQWELDAYAGDGPCLWLSDKGILRRLWGFYLASPTSILQQPFNSCATAQISTQVAANAVSAAAIVEKTVVPARVGLAREIRIYVPCVRSTSAVQLDSL
ncbi:Protein kinase domain-containing protein [Mycena kentingensis (nom. inval.)]|nr:Protein kinase domain-containing protein [Mycena kentingensis (nom. inval.)]